VQTATCCIKEVLDNFKLAEQITAPQPLTRNLLSSAAGYRVVTISVILCLLVTKHVLHKNKLMEKAMKKYWESLTGLIQAKGLSVTNKKNCYI
jgi:hypothetical protein